MNTLRRLLVAGLAVSGRLLVAQNLTAADIDREHELVIRHLKVVESDEARLDRTGGRLALPFLLENLGFDSDPKRARKAALLSFLRAWKAAPGETGPDPGDELIKSWKFLDGHAEDLPDASWDPDFANAPFRLLAITNRVDLVKSDDFTSPPKNGGELRFVYCLTGGSATKATALPRHLTLILEYGVPARTWDDVRAWALAWHKLGKLDLAKPDYVKALADLTTRVTRRGAAPNQTHGSALLRIRTSDQAVFSADAWRMREFQVDSSGRFFAATTAETPRDDLQLSPTLAAYIHANVGEIKAGKHHVQEGLLGSQAKLVDAGAVLWAPDGVDPEARFRFALNTCSGCHGVEARPKSSPPAALQFTHIAPRPINAAAELSPFLEDVAPIDDNTQTAYPQLREITARQAFMAQLVNEALAANPLSQTESHGPSPELLRLMAARGNRAD
jgi:hypothetical protein